MKFKKKFLSILLLFLSINLLSQEVRKTDWRIGHSYGVNFGNFQFAGEDIGVKFGANFNVLVDYESFSSNWLVESGIGLSYISLNEWESKVIFPSDIDVTTGMVAMDDKTVFTDTRFLYLSMPILVGYGLNIQKNDKIKFLVGSQIDFKVNQMEKGYFTENGIQKDFEQEINDYKNIMPYGICSIRYEKMLKERLSIGIQSTLGFSLGIRENILPLKSNFKRSILGLSFVAIHKI